MSKMALSTKNLDENNKAICRDLRVLGNAQVRLYAAQVKMDLHETRLLPLSAIREVFNRLKKLGVIQSYAKMQCFRAGWRGTANLKKHGTVSAYASGCRCEDCRETWRIRGKQRRELKKAEAAQKALAAKLVEIRDNQFDPNKIWFSVGKGNEEYETGVMGAD